MRDIKFRARDEDGYMFTPFQIIFNPEDSIMGKKGTVIVFENKDKFGINGSAVQLMQYTGLKDNTKWEQLTEKEKREFYSQHESEDGITIKYQNVDDVKHLWNGKEIYEGDILSFHVGKDLKEVFTGDVYWFDNEAEFEIRHPEGYHGRYSFKRDFIEVYSMQVIGNIYENPELLEA